MQLIMRRQVDLIERMARSVPLAVCHWLAVPARLLCPSASMQLPWCDRSFNGPGPVAHDCLSTGTTSAPWPVVVLDISHQLPALLSLHEQVL